MPSSPFAVYLTVPFDTKELMHKLAGRNLGDSDAPNGEWVSTPIPLMGTTVTSILRSHAPTSPQDSYLVVIDRTDWEHWGVLLVNRHNFGAVDAIRMNASESGWILPILLGSD